MARQRTGSHGALTNTATRQQLRPRQPISAKQLLAQAAASAQKASKLTPAQQQLAATRAARRAGQPPPT